MTEQEVAAKSAEIRGGSVVGALYRFMFPNLSGSDALLRAAEEAVTTVASDARELEEKLRARETKGANRQARIAEMMNPESSFRAKDQQQRSSIAGLKEKLARLETSSEFSVAETLEAESIRQELVAADKDIEEATTQLESEAQVVLPLLEKSRVETASIIQRLDETRGRHAELTRELETYRLEDRKRRWRFLANAIFQSLWPVFIWNFVMMLPTRRDELPSIQPFAWAILASFGVQLYTLREELRRVYALAELAAALFVAHVAGQQWLADGGSKGALQAIAAAYLFVRAIDNMAIGQRAANAADKSWEDQLKTFLAR